MFKGTQEAALKGYHQVCPLTDLWLIQYPKTMFRITLPTSSFLVASRSHLKEMFSASEDDLSFAKDVADSLELRYIFQKSIAENHYHAHITKVELTRHISEMMPGIVDELGAAMDEEIQVNEGSTFSSPLMYVDWTSICSYQKTINIVARISNRVFVGLPLCTPPFKSSYVGRNKEYLEHAVKHATAVAPVASVLRYVPIVLKPYAPQKFPNIRIVVQLFGDLHRGRQASYKFISPIIMERRQMMQSPDYKKPVHPP
jgi:hypothetical protein